MSTSTDGFFVGISPLLSEIGQFDFDRATLATVSGFNRDLFALNTGDFDVAEVSFFIRTEEKDLVLVNATINHCSSKNYLILLMEDSMNVKLVSEVRICEKIIGNLRMEIDIGTERIVDWKKVEETLEKIQISSIHI